MKKPFRFLSLAALALLGMNLALSQDPVVQPPVDSAKKAEEIMNNFIKASGAEAQSKIKSMILVQYMQISGQNLKATVFTYTKEPNKLLTVTDMPPVGKIRQGFDGKIAWSDNPIQGLRKLEGEEKELFTQSLAANNPSKTKELYKKMEYVGREKLNDRDVDVIKLTPKVGKPQTQYFDVETHLMVRQVSEMAGPTGNTPYDVTLLDYKDYNGLMLPSKTVAKVAMMEMVIGIDRVKFDVAIDDKVFAYPAPTKSAVTKKTKVTKPKK